MWFALTLFIIALAGLAALFSFKLAELSGKETLLASISRFGDAFLSQSKRALKHKSKEVHHEHVKPALRMAGEKARDALASGIEWSIREMRQAARLVRGKEPTAQNGSVSVFLKQMLDFKNGKKEELEK